MQITTDSQLNVGYIKIVPKTKVAYSLEFDDTYVADFDHNDKLVGIELLDAKSYKPGELQSLMSRANAEGIKQRRGSDPAPVVTRSA